MNAIADDKKRRAMDHLIECYGLVYSLCVPELPKSETYCSLTKLFDLHFKSTLSVFDAKAKLYSATQKPGRNMSDWAARVRNLAINCEFTGTMIDMMLRDRFIIEFEKGHVQATLFKQKNATEVAKTEVAAQSGAKETEQIVVKMEPTVQHVSSRSHPSGENGRHQHGRNAATSGGENFSSSAQVSTSSARKGTKFLCCGRKNHLLSKCPFRDYNCHLQKVT